MRTFRLLAATSLAALAVVVAPSSASAMTVVKQTPTSCDQHEALTDWGYVLRLPQFAVPGGTLTAVTVSQAVSVRSDYRVESRNGAARTDTLTLDKAHVQMQVPGMTATAASLNAGSRTYSFTAFDGTIDFSGTSGASGGFGVGSDSNVQNATDLAAWIGGGAVLVTAGSDAATNSTLSGNYRLEWDTTSLAKACVTYTYTEQVLVCIGDYVWHDEDKDGIQDPGEASLPDRQVNVHNGAGTNWATTTTDANGRWKVCNLEPSQACVVDVDLPDGWTLTAAAQGTDPSLDSNGFANGPDARIGCVTPPSGEDLTFDVGVYKVPVDTPESAPSPPPARITLTKTGSRATMASRGTVVFVVRVTNRGGREVRSLNVCDIAPMQLAFTTRPRGATIRNGQLCWSAAKLAPGRTLTFRYTMRAANVASRQCVVNRATAVAGVGGTASARDGVCITATELGVLQLAG